VTQRIERRLAAIVCADVVGYSRLLGADEAAMIGAWREHRTAILGVAAAHRGRLVGTQGDGLLFEFASVVDAVAGALAIQETMATRAAGEPEDRRFRLRIGVNLGDVIAEGADILGDGVNVAARLEALAEPGTVCVSGVVRDQVLGKLPVAFDDLGPRSVKNIQRAVHAWRVRPAGPVPPPPPSDAPPATSGRKRVLAAVTALLLLCATAALGTWLAGVWPWESPQRPDGVAIMVLPFESPAGQDQEYLGDGITEDIITALSKMAALANRQNLHVIGRSTAFSHKGQKVDVRRLARELSLTHVLVGSVRRDGGRLRIYAELIDAWTGRSNWAERYDRNAGDVFDIQDDVTGKVVSTLMAMLDTGSPGGGNPLAGGQETGEEARRREEEQAARRRAQEARQREEQEARRRAQEAARREREPPRSALPPAPPAPVPAPAPPAATARPAPQAPAPVARRAAAPVHRPSHEVYEQVLQARKLANEDSRDAVLQARALLLRATEAEPRYVPALLALADTYLTAYARRWTEADGAVEGLEAALLAADAALALMPDAPQAWATRGLTLMHLGRHEEARAAAGRAVSARAADTAALERAALILVFDGEPAAALDLLARARKHDPLPSPAALAVEARALFLLARDGEAIRATEACLARHASERDCLEIAAAALARQHKADAARAMLARLRTVDPAFNADTPRTRFAKSYRRAADLDALVTALRKAGA
jgi:TolB-like protein/class 3 adenylate cyclase